MTNLIPSLAAVKEQVYLVRGDKLEVLSVFKKESKLHIEAVCLEHGAHVAPLKNVLDPNLRGCPRCNKQKRKVGTAYNHMFTELVARARNVHGNRYVYNSVEYISGKRVFKAYCEDHGDFTMWVGNHLKAKHGCSKCGDVATRSSVIVSETEWIARAKTKHGDTYSNYSVMYKDGRAHFELDCTLHGRFAIEAKSHAVAGCGCLKCFREIHSKKILRLEDAHFITEAKKATTLNILGVSGSGNTRKIHVECPTHGEYPVRLADLKRGVKCAKCANGSYGSKLTHAVTEMLDRLSVEYTTEARILEDRYRWDILIPSKNLVLELDGIYWHSTALKSDTAAMQNKAKKAEAYGYAQINLFEDEINNKPQIVEALLKARLGLLSESIGARTCTVSDLTANVARDFLDRYHIQGFSKGTSYLGLHSNDSLVAVMVLEFRENGRAGKKSDSSCNLVRYATSTQVVGGFTKLLTIAKRSSPDLQKIVTYSDNRLFTGNLYSKSGFKKVSESRPDYCYVRNSERIHKRSRQKSYFKQMADRGLARYDPSLTEFELAELNKHYRLYDRGRTKWVLDVK